MLELWKKIKTSWPFVAAFSALAAILLIVAKMLKSPPIAEKAANVIEKGHKPSLDAWNAQLDTLHKTQTTDMAAVEKLEQKVQDSHTAMIKVYEAAGLSESEIIERLTKLPS